MKKKVYAGIRATGRLHLGNYLGSLKGMIELVNSGSYDCVFQVVDLHTITTPYDPKTLQSSIKEVLLDYLAAGLPIEKCHLTVQSLVPEHMLLSYYLGTICSVNKLEDLPTYKEKKAQHPQYVNLGLLYYPVLMAADILAYKAESVPTGIDQEPHIELAREIARKFNGMFGETFPEPKRFATVGEYVPALSGKGKMSKSIEGSSIYLTDSLEEIEKKIAKIPTDSGLGEYKSAGEGVKSLFKFVELFQGKDKYEGLVKKYETEGLRYSEVKKELARSIDEDLKPIREKRKYFEENYGEVEKIVSEGAEYCRNVTKETLQEVQRKMGII